MNDKICAVPWVHLNFEPNGKVVPCCLTSHHDYFAGDLNKQPIEEIWNSDNMKKLRKQMMAESMLKMLFIDILLMVSRAQIQSKKGLNHAYTFSVKFLQVAA